VVVAYGHLLKPDLLAIPHQGMINVHASLLPELRGAAPIQWAILRGDTRTGITIMQMEAGLDSGPIPDRGHDPFDDRAVPSSPVARPVEVDDVQPTDSPIGESPSDRDRVAAVRRLPVEVALAEPDDAAPTKIDRHQQIEGCHPLHAVLTCYYAITLAQQHRAAPREGEDETDGRR